MARATRGDRRLPVPRYPSADPERVTQGPAAVKIPRSEGKMHSLGSVKRPWFLHRGKTPGGNLLWYCWN